MYRANHSKRQISQLIALSTMFLFACSKQEVKEAEQAEVSASIKEQLVYMPEGKWVVTSDMCEGSLKIGELEAVTLTKDSVKIGNATFNGEWIATNDNDVELMSSYIDKSLPDCLLLTGTDFKVGTYEVNQNKILFALSDNQKVAISYYNERYRSALPYSAEAVRAAIAADPFADEPLPYDPFDESSLVEQEVEKSDEFVELDESTKLSELAGSNL